MKSNRKIKFGIIDILIIVFVVIALVIGYKFLNGGAENSGNEKMISYTVELRNQSGEYKDLIKIGDDIKDSIKGGYLGKVSGVEFKDATDVIENKNDGTFSVAKYQDSYDVYVTIEGIPTTYGDNIMFASQEIKVGKNIYIKNKNYVGSGYIVEVNVNE